MNSSDILPRNYDCSEVLNNYNINYKEFDNYLEVGEVSITQGWILHISIVKTQLIDLLYQVLPKLIEFNVAFKIPKSKDIAKLILEGTFGYSQVGKIITIYPENEKLASDISEELIELTKTFTGPDIATDSYLGGTVYVRYGSHRPLLFLDEYGNPNRYIYDYKGELIKDEYFIPFKIPIGVKWPFNTPPHQNDVKARKTIINKYKPIIELKKDAKGNVIKAMRIKNLFKLQNCIIKEGKQFMCSDDNGRDISDRLKWQYILHTTLEGKIPLPKIYDFFEENGTTFLVMEYIDGVILEDFIANTNEGHTWHTISKERQINLINLLLKIIRTIDCLHDNGIIHRDITCVNFIVTSQNEPVLIDIELAYDLRKQLPSPPFRLGTPGFMSPEQVAVKTPTIKEDVYGIGALMILFFTGLNPRKFGEVSHDKIITNLTFFIQENSISELIVSCLDSNPEKRPNILQIIKCITSFRDKISSNSPYNIGKPHTSDLSRNDTESIINQYLLTTSSPLMINQEQIWISAPVGNTKMISNEILSNTVYFGFYAGISGALYTLSIAKEAGLTIDDKLFSKNFSYVQNYFLANLPNVVPGYYFGSAGVAQSICTSIKAGLIQRNEKILEDVHQCLIVTSSSLDIASGIAGQGIATINCSNLLESSVADTILHQCNNVLLSSQLPDGSWNITPQQTKGKPTIYTGFSNGIAGIVYYLIQYYNKYKDPQVAAAAVKGLFWLLQKLETHNGISRWPTSNDKNKTYDPWFSNGYTGISYVFLKAFETFQDEKYKQVAETVLESHPSHLIAKNSSFSDGIVGIGETYLEAFRVLKNDKWKKRANWIKDVLIHSHKYENGHLYWLIDDSNNPTADFMTGNNGIIHFLIRTYNSEKVTFPI